MSDDLLKEGREFFAAAESAESDNRKTYLDDVNFARAGKQWPDNIRTQREREGRPVLTINKMPAFIRQVVNDARQNKPAIHVHPVDSGADLETAEVMGGLIRSIETSSDADVAYDTATECAVSGGFGYLRVVPEYQDDRSFEQDLAIKRIANPLSVYGDPNSQAADSSDWDDAFVVEQTPERKFKEKYSGAAETDFGSAAWTGAGTSWRNTETKTVTVAEWWKRREADEKVLLLSNGLTVKEADFLKNPDFQAMREAGAIQVMRERVVKCHKVTQHIMSGAEILSSLDWPGKYIPVIPVYGDEFDIEGKRFWRSLIHNAIDAQRMFNYWRTNSTELVALAPRVPFIGPAGAFDDDPRWNTANTTSHSFLEYKPVPGQPPPQRQPLDMGVAAGALQEALNASDDMKAIIGLYDASLGARSNETSGKAIMARQREGDVATFHFIDNMARAIRHTGRVLLDLIPHYYTAERVVRIIGEDGKPESKTINAPYEVMDPKTGQPVMEEGQDEFGNKVQRVMMAMHDVRVGKYDITVSTGPSFTTRREEAAYQMGELIRADPRVASIVGPEMAKNLDWPGADKIAEKLDALAGGQIPPELQKQIEDGQQLIQQQAREIEDLKMQAADDEAKIQSAERIKMLDIASKERIAKAQAVSDMEVDKYVANIKAQATIAAAAMRPAPQQSAQQGR